MSSDERSVRTITIYLPNGVNNEAAERLLSDINVLLDAPEYSQPLSIAQFPGGDGRPSSGGCGI